MILNFGPVVQEISFKDISYLELWWPLSSVERNHLCIFGRGNHEDTFLQNYFEFGPVIPEETFGLVLQEILFFYLELWQPLCSVEQNHLCNLGRVYH